MVVLTKVELAHICLRLGLKTTGTIHELHDRIFESKGAEPEKIPIRPTASNLKQELYERLEPFNMHNSEMREAIRMLKQDNLHFGNQVMAKLHHESAKPIGHENSTKDGVC